MTSTLSLHAGDFVVTRPGAGAVLVVATDRWSVTFECTDGVRERFEETAYRPLAVQTAGWRPATPEQIERFERLHQAAPENWN